LSSCGGVKKLCSPPGRGTQLGGERLDGAKLVWYALGCLRDGLRRWPPDTT
jgi:hypothetical protein